MTFRSRLSSIQIGVIMFLAWSLGACSEPNPTGTEPIQPTAYEVPSIDHEWSRLAQDSIPGFAGIYVDGADQIVVSATTAESEESARAFAQRWRRSSQHRDAPIQFRLVEYDFDQLRTWMDALRQLLGNGNVNLLDADEVRNAVVVGAGPGVMKLR